MSDSMISNYFGHANFFNYLYLFYQKLLSVAFLRMAQISVPHWSQSKVDFPQVLPTSHLDCNDTASSVELLSCA